MTPWKKFCVPSVMMKAGRRSQLTRRALIMPRQTPMEPETRKAKAKLSMPQRIIICAET